MFKRQALSVPTIHWRQTACLRWAIDCSTIYMSIKDEKSLYNGDKKFWPSDQCCLHQIESDLHIQHAHLVCVTGFSIDMFNNIYENLRWKISVQWGHNLLTIHRPVLRLSNWKWPSYTTCTSFSVSRFSIDFQFKLTLSTSAVIKEQWPVLAINSFICFQ